MHPFPFLRRTFAVGAAITMAGVSLVACGGQNGETLPNGVQLVKKDQLTTCTHLPFPPFQVTKNGEVVGFDVDMIDLVAKKLGVEQKIVDTPFETIKTGSALEAGQCDVAAAGMTIKPKREKNIDFSEPYFDATQALLTTKGSSVKALEDIKDQDLKLGSQSATTGENYAQQHGLNPTSYETSQALLNGLRTKQVDVIIMDYPVVRSWLTDPKTAKKFEAVANLQTGEHYGFAVKEQGKEKLLQVINKTLKEAKANGSYDRVYQKWSPPLAPRTGSGQSGEPSEPSE